MATLAELQIKVDTRQVLDGKQALNDFADAADKAGKAGKSFGDSNKGGGGLAPSSETGKVKDLSSAIDAQTAKLTRLGEQRKALESSNMKSTMPAEYERLNRIIDANINLVTRQGNAIDQLNAKQNRDTEKVAATQQRQIELQDRLTRATERRELVVSNAAAREQRQLDQTINGLSRQAKAMNDYTKTVETLNKARALSGMSSDHPTLSGGEYESWVKQAQAQRDAATAVADTTAEMERAKSKLDTFTATLGKAERAEVEFARATNVLNEAQRLGVITQEQYDSKLAAFASKRDAAVAAANSNVAAEERFERQLRQVTTAFDPLERAQQQYTTSVAILKQGLDSGVLSVDQFNKALASQEQALDAVKRKHDSSTRIASEYDDALKAVLPYRTELENLERQQNRLDAAMKQGLVTTPAQIKAHQEATAAIKSQTEEYKRRISEGSRFGNTLKQEQAALRGMPAQITDIVVSLQGGQAPLTVLLQQGGQIKDMFGGIGPAISGTVRAVASMLTPMTVGAAAIGAFAIAANSGSEEIVEFNRALITSRNYAGLTGNDFTTFAGKVDDLTGTTGKAAQAMILLQSNGKIAGDQFVKIGEAAVLMQRATGQSMDETIADFASLGKDPVTAAVTLDEKYKFLTASVLAQADALVQQGKQQDAVTLLQNEMAKAATETSKKVIEEAGLMEQAWYGVKDAVTAVWEAMKNVGKTDSNAERLTKLQADQKRLIENWYDGNKEAAENDGPNSRYQINKSNIEFLEKEIAGQKQLAQEESKRDANRRSTVSFTEKLSKEREANLANVDKVAAAEEKLNRVLQEEQQFREKIKQLGETISARTEKDLKIRKQSAEEDLNRAREQQNKKDNPKGPLDTRNLQEVKSNLSLVVAEYDRYYKQMDALRKSGVISEEAAYHGQIAILQQQQKSVDEEYAKQISSIEKLQGKKGNTTAQNISLENQMTKAEAERIKASEAIQAKQEQLTIRFQGDIDKRNLAIKSYNDALREQVRALEEQGRRSVSAVGQGDRQAGVNGQLADNDNWYAREQRRLSEQLSGKDISPEEHAQKLADLTRAHSDMSKQIIKNDEDMQAANMDWGNGFNRAIDNALEYGLNFANLMDNALTNTFESAGDALATFVTTGKMNFSDFARSVIADMAQMAAKQAAMGALSSLFSFGAAAFGGWAAGGTTAAAGASGGFGQLGGSYTGSGIFSSVQAQGGAWSGGTQMFAQGGAFTNSIVSTPTSFGMANGARGIMGEAGEEAIVPLARTRNGDLGVRMIGGETSGSGGVLVNVYVSESGSSTETSGDGGDAYKAMGDQIGVIVQQQVYSIINKETRKGGSLQPQQ